MSKHPDHCPHCGGVLSNPRSLADHRRLFGLLRAAFLHWPETEAYQPTSEDQLRAYLLVKVGHHDTAFIPYPPECQDNAAVLALFRLAVEATGAALAQRAGYFDVRVSAGGVEILTPKSISFAVLGQKAFGQIREALEAAIEAAIGRPADQILRETERAA